VRHTPSERTIGSGNWGTAIAPGPGIWASCSHSDIDAWEAGGLSHDGS
jgi:hypothetical protein